MLTRKRKLALAFVFFIVFLVGIPVLLGTITWVRMTEPYRGYQGAELFVEIPPGSGTAEIGRRLVEAGVVSDSIVFRAALWYTGNSRDLKAGEYRFDRAMTAVDVVDKLARGDVYGRRVTFPEGLNIREMAKVYEAKGFGPARDFIAAARDVSLIKDLDPEATDLEGYLFPETYALPRGTPAAKLIALMANRFRTVFTDDMRRAAQEQGFTVRQVVALASVVEKETGKAEERPVVSAVYRTRFRIGMPMQADPTVVYALEEAKRYDGNIRRADLSFDSPYNTYKYPGLPPGPIASPGKASLDAALAPADVKYLYFVSRNDGSHVFAETLDQHNANVRKFQVEFFRKKKGLGGRE
jgi:UPF0755 protein